ncbi:MAG TPA: biotin--[acetyl-CoA-carboxylase] ligase [Clostridiales bacterium]|nr:biotin--[acetyl-CoA-carboxylase] ligase [Clostridiales bacterium]
MELKMQILKYLEANRGTSISGTKLAEELSVTRSAIWKGIKALQQEGYNIEAVTNKGYCLALDNDIVSVESLSPYLRGKSASFDIEVHQSVGSTNTLAKEMAADGAKEGTVIIAREQTSGRGRMGRTFYSPNSTGIYFSIILRPSLSMEDSLKITTATAVAIAKAIETIAEVPAQIKWVNDIFVNNKKVCGILTEASLNFESGGLEYAVVGIGLNVTTEAFPEDIKNVAGSIYKEKPEDIPVTSILLAEILNNIGEMMASLADNKYLEEYKSRSFLIGKEILVLRNKKAIPAKALDIDDKARLVVEYNDKTREALTSGEVSIRPIQ